MKKSMQIVMIVLSVALTAFVMFLCFRMIFEEEKPTTSPEPVTKINQTYEGSRIHATAFDIKAFETLELQGKKQTLVIVGFEIKNISKQKNVLVNSATYKAYVDDVAVGTEPLFQYDEHLDADLAPGKRAKGYWGILVPADSKTVEIQVDDNSSKNKTAVFILDIPPVESITPDEYFASLHG